MTTKADKIILGIQICDRLKAADKVQKILTIYGCNIKTRLGLHEVTDDFCSESGLILLELFGESHMQQELENSLRDIDGIIVQKMKFEH